MKKRSLLTILISVMSVLELQAIIAFSLTMDKIVFSSSYPNWYFAVAGGSFVLLMLFAVLLGMGVTEIEKYND
ncbi:MAG: hypothetical protein DRJ01_04960 [Bacteroidetes bacterium]|nr:MAG: hypothetical protein DRJ01_04960 [Bacteroidota bacterium]